MTPETQDVLAGSRRWWAEQGDAVAWLDSLPADSADLVMCSPPYTRCRTYLEDGQDPGVARATEEWVAWMRQVVHACLRVCTGVVALVVDDQQADWSYGGGPFLLMADLLREGVYARHPAVYYRVGIPGSGHDLWRNDWEPILLFTRERRRLLWSDPTACGHAPKWAPGGEMSHRLASGARVNQWGGHKTTGRSRKQDGTLQPPGRPSHAFVEAEEGPGSPGLFDGLPGASESDGGPIVTTGPAVTPSPIGGGARRRNGQKKTRRKIAKFREGMHSQESTEYTPPTLANPGNVIKCVVGGNGRTGDKLCHANEAPYPEDLVLPFVVTLAAPGSLVIDPFAGSGTTLAVALACGRRALGCDLRASMVRLSRKRVSKVTPPLPGMEP